MEREENLARCEICDFISQESNVRRHIMQVHQSPVQVVREHNYGLEEFEIEGSYEDYSQNNEFSYNESMTQSQNDGEVEDVAFQKENDVGMIYVINNKNNESEKIHWTSPQVRLLIQLYDENKSKFEDKKTRNKKVWKFIADEMNRIGRCKFTPEQCENKFKNLKKNYKKISDNNNKTGRGALTWPFFRDMDSIFSKDPDVNPISTCSNLDGPSSSTSHPVGEEDMRSISSPQTIQINSQGVKRKKTSAEEPEWFMKFREDCQRRHEEKMQRQDNLLKILEKLAEK